MKILTDVKIWWTSSIGKSSPMMEIFYRGKSFTNGENVLKNFFVDVSVVVPPLSHLVFSLLKHYSCWPTKSTMGILKTVLWQINNFFVIFIRGFKFRSLDTPRRIDEPCFACIHNTPTHKDPRTSVVWCRENIKCQFDSL